MTERDHSRPGYFSGWQTWDWVCPTCDWKGNGTDLAHEDFNELFELHCPSCNHKLGLITYPTREETQIAANAGNSEGLTHLTLLDVIANNRSLLEDSKKGRKNLPKLIGDNLEFTFDTDDGSTSLNPSWLTLTCGDTVIHRERSGFEHWEAIIEISKLVLKTYRRRVAWIDPSDAGLCLLGDDFSAKGKITRFLKANNVAPPTGPWAADVALKDSN